MDIKRKKKSAICVLILLIWIVIAAVMPVYAVKFPEPTEDFYVNDYADVLSGETKQHIIEINDSLYSQTGAQVVVVTQDFLDGMSIEDYGYNLFNEWEIGSREKNNGVLLLLAIGEDDYRITLGRGSESILSMNFLSTIRDQCLEPPFSRGDYDQAASDTVDAIVAKMAEYYKVSLSSNVHAPEEKPDRIGDSAFLTLVIIVIVLASVFGGFFRSYVPPRRNIWRNMPPPPPPIHGPARPRHPGGPGWPGGFGGPRPPRSGGGFGGFSGGGSHHSGGGRSGGGGSSRGGGIGRK